MRDQIRKDFPDGLSEGALERLNQVEYEKSERRSAESRIADIREHIQELEERIADIQDWLDGKSNIRPELYRDSDWDSYANG